MNTPLPLDAADIKQRRHDSPYLSVEELDDMLDQCETALTLRARVAECVRAAAAVTGTDAEMCATEAGADTNHGVVLAALDWQAKRVAELEANNEGSLKAATYWKEQHDRAAKRVTELEAELASIKRQCIIRRDHEREDLMAHGETVLCSTELVARLYDDRIEAEAHANALRDACTDRPSPGILKCRLCGGSNINHAAGKAGARFPDIRHNGDCALASTPAASLAAHDAEVVKRGCAAIREVRIEHTPALEDDDQGPFLHESDVANLTRAIVERAHKTHPSGGADCMAQEVK